MIESEMPITKPHQGESIVFDKHGVCFKATDKFQHLLGRKIPHFDKLPFLQSPKSTWIDMAPGDSIHYHGVNWDTRKPGHYDISIRKDIHDSEIQYVCFIEDQADYYKNLQRTQSEFNEKRMTAKAKIPQAAKPSQKDSQASGRIRRVIFEYDEGHQRLHQLDLPVRTQHGNRFSASLDEYQLNRLQHLTGVRMVAIFPPS